QTANTLIRTAQKVADAMLDLHSGGDRSIVPFYALYRNDGSETARKAEALARAAATPDIWASTDSWLTGAMFTHLTAQGIPSLIVEGGGGAQVPEEHLNNYVAAITGVAQAVGILPGTPPQQPRYRILDDALLVYSKRGGFFEPSVVAGEVLQEGQDLGRIIHPYRDEVAVMHTPGVPCTYHTLRLQLYP